MKNEVLISSILLLNPVANIAAAEVNSVKSAVTKTMQYLADLSFESPEVKSREFNLWDANLGQVVTETREYKIKVSFLISRAVETSSYDYNGRRGNGEMDYEAIIQTIDANTGEVISAQDSTFFAKRISENKFRIYDCNSTSNCWDKDDSYISFADMLIFDTPKGKILKTIRNASHSFDDYIFEDKKLLQSF